MTQSERNRMISELRNEWRFKGGPYDPDFKGEPHDWTRDDLWPKLLREISKDDAFCCVLLDCDVPGSVWECKMIRMSYEENGPHKPEPFETCSTPGEAVCSAWLRWQGKEEE